MVTRVKYSLISNKKHAVAISLVKRARRNPTKTGTMHIVNISSALIKKYSAIEAKEVR